MAAITKKDKRLVSSVEDVRWQTAQHWEREHWLRNQKNLAKYGKNMVWKLLAYFGKVEKYRGDDRNKWWKGSFDNYSFLPSPLENAIEVGCGPYTNIRLIRQSCHLKHIFISDPLIRTYAKFKMTFVSEMHRDGACLDDHPLEELPFADAYFDLVVMINVLDHVRDAHACMKNAIRVLKPGGFMVLGQDLTNEEDRMQQPDGLEIGHPITLDADWFAPYLAGFEPALERILPREAGWAPDWHYGTLLFAGEKR